MQANDLLNHDPRLKRILFDVKMIQQRVTSLADEIATDSEYGTTLHLIGVLKGSFIFMADLVRALALTGRVKVRCNFIQAQAYGNELKGAAFKPKVELKLMPNEIAGRDFLLIDDILDQGFTLAHLQQKLKEQGAQSVKICVLLEKELQQASAEVEKIRSQLQMHYVGFKVTDEWVVGYGLDAAQEFRELPFIATVHEEYFRS